MNSAKPWVTHIVRNIGPSVFALNELYLNQKYNSNLDLGNIICFVPTFFSLSFNTQVSPYDPVTYLNIPQFARLILTSKDSSKYIYHIHNPISLIMLPLMRIFWRKCRIIMTLHNNFAFFKLHQKLLLIVFFPFLDKLILCGNQLFSSLPLIIKLYTKLYPKFVASIANGINLDVCINLLKSNPVRIKNSITVVSKFTSQKNWKFVIELISNLPYIKFVNWYGVGPDFYKALSYAESLNIQNKINFLGVKPRDEVYKSLSTTAYYINASRWEGLCVADLEAIALGCYPLLSDIPQRTELASLLQIPLLPLNVLSWVKYMDIVSYSSDAKLINLHKDRLKLLQDNYSVFSCLRQYEEAYYSLSFD